MKVSGSLEKTEKRLKKVNALLFELRKLREEKLAEWKSEETELVNEKDSLENIRVLQLVKLSNLDIEEIAQRLTPEGRVQVFSELKAPLPDDEEIADEETGSIVEDDFERNENDEEDE